MFFLLLSLFVAIGTIIYLFFNYFKTEINLTLKQKSLERLLNFYSFYSSKFIYIFILHFVMYLIVYFINKDFILYLIYGNLLSFIFVIVSTFIDIYLSEIIFNFKDINNILTMFFFRIIKYVLFLSIFLIAYSLYIKTKNIDFAVIFCGVVFSVFSFAIISPFTLIEKNINISSFLLLILSVFFIFFRYLDSYLFEILSIIFFVYLVSEICGIVFYERFIRFRNLKFLDIVGLFFIIFIIIVFLKYYRNMYVFLAIFGGYICFYIIDNFKNMKKNYLVFFVFLSYIIFKFFSFWISKYTVDFNESTLLFFMLASLSPFFFRIGVENNFYMISENTDDYINKIGFKIPYVFLTLILILFFTKIYELMKTYYGYYDYADISVVIFGVFLFYVYEYLYERFILKTDIFFLKFVHTISINAFIFSAVIVLVSFFTNLNFTNLFYIFTSMSIISVFLSEKFFTHIISIFYLSMFYLLLYV